MTDTLSTECPVNVTEVPVNDLVKAWLVKAEDLPFLSFAFCFKKAGKAQDKKKGTANLLSHMMLEGCGKWNSQEFKELLQSKNIQLNVCPNEDTFVVFVRCPTEILTETLEILNELFFSPNFKSRDMDKIKAQFVGEMTQALHDHMTAAREELTKFVMPKGHPYIKDIKTNLKVINTIDEDDLRDFMKGHLAQNTLQVFAAGNFDQEKFIKGIADITSKFTPKSSGVDIPTITLQNQGSTKHIEMDIPQTVMLFVQPGLSPQNPDIYAAEIINSMLGGMSFASILSDEVREKRGLAYHISTRLQQSQAMHAILGIAMTQTETVDQVTKIIKESWQKLADGNINQEDLDFHKRYMIGAFALAFTSTKDVVSSLVARYQIGQNLDQLKDRNSEYAKLTLKDLKRVAKDMLHPDKLSFILVGRK